MTAPTATIDIGTLIESRPNVCGGSPVLTGTRMPVKALAARHKLGMTVEEIVGQFPEVEPAAIYAGLAYYFANTAAVDADLEADRTAEKEWSAEEERRKRATRPS